MWLYKDGGRMPYLETAFGGDPRESWRHSERVMRTVARTAHRMRENFGRHRPPDTVRVADEVLALGRRPLQVVDKYTVRALLAYVREDVGDGQADVVFRLREAPARRRRAAGHGGSRRDSYAPRVDGVVQRLLIHACEVRGRRGARARNASWQSDL